MATASSLLSSFLSPSHFSALTPSLSLHPFPFLSHILSSSYYSFPSSLPPLPFSSLIFLLPSPLPPSFTGLHEGNAESKFTRCSEGKRETDFWEHSSCVRLPPWVSQWQLIEAHTGQYGTLPHSLSSSSSSTFVKILEEASESPEDIAKCFLNQVSHMTLPCIT